MFVLMSGLLPSFGINSLLFFFAGGLASIPKYVNMIEYVFSMLLCLHVLTEDKCLQYIFTQFTRRTSHMTWLNEIVLFNVPSQLRLFLFRQHV